MEEYSVLFLGNCCIAVSCSFSNNCVKEDKDLKENTLDNLEESTEKDLSKKITTLDELKKWMQKVSQWAVPMCVSLKSIQWI